MKIFSDYHTIFIPNNKCIDEDFWIDLNESDIMEAIVEDVRNSSDVFEWVD